MESYYIVAGLVLNSALIMFNRFVRKLPDWLYLPGLILGIILMLIGVLQNR